MALTAALAFLALFVSALAQPPLGPSPTPTVGHLTPAAACSALPGQLEKIVQGLPANIFGSGILAEGTTFSNGSFDNAAPVVDLPELCRFGVNFNTSTQSTVRFEVWMPTTTWNGRFAFVGNGVDSGAVNYPAMGGAIFNFGFAVASTDTGHEGGGLDGTWAVNNPNSQVDFGFRAVHLSTIFAKNAVKSFYSAIGHQQSVGFKNYWLGCSSGGKQGLKEIQFFPEEYDGVLAGSPAWFWSHLTAWTIMGQIFNPANVSSSLTFDDWQTVHAGIISQCDGLDGLVDGIVTNPAICHIDFNKINITPAQRVTAAQLYANWTRPDGELLFPGFSPGAEELGLAGAVGGAFQFTEDYFKYQVLNFTSVAAAANVTFTEAFLEHLIPIADATNPGQITANDFDIEPFIGRGGKLIQYVGTQDQLIPYGSSLLYYMNVVKTLGRHPSEAYRMFAVPGMGHCGGGSKAPNLFGGDTGVSGTKTANLDADHNAILALIQWVEHGVAPEQIIGTGTANNVTFQRPLCVWPKFFKFKGGNRDANNVDSFFCQ